MQYYEIITTCTGKPCGNSKDGYSVFDEHTKRFSNLDDVKKYIDDTYKQNKREKIYRDGEKEAEHVGYCYHFKNRDISHDSKAWFQIDWVEIYEIKSKPIIVN